MSETDPNTTTDQPLRVDIISDVVCPWCIIGYKQLETAMAQTGTKVDVHWHPFELVPEMPTEGRNLLEHLMAKYNRSREDGLQMRAKLTETGADLGFKFNYTDDMKVYNTSRAHQLLHWAEGTPHQHDLKMALIKAFFTDQRNISDPETLADIAASVGLDRDEALAIANEDRFAEEVKTEEQYWHNQGIQGVPAMVFQQRYLVTGAQGVENFASILEQLKAEQAKAPAPSA